ncbi:MAG TPA: hypothetical protein VMB21_10875 [Candidatus Limnocylindria bacterium]|jgi:hypothetical protein|nr:hypothetical protein [Candidatus Limnocylindria bacterium]
MEISEIYVHDAQLRRVIEDVEANLIVMQVDLPILELNEELQPRFLVFEGAYGHQAFEGPTHGVTAILDMHVVGKSECWQHVRLDTAAGYRLLFCLSVSVSKDNPIK